MPNYKRQISQTINPFFISTRRLGLASGEYFFYYMFGFGLGVGVGATPPGRGLG